MDARLGRWLFSLFPLVLASTGCSLFDRTTDRLVQDELRETKREMKRPTSDPLGTGATIRPQAPLPPEGPLTPLVLPASEPKAEKPIPQPATTTTTSFQSTVAPVESRLAPQAETRVKVVATVGADGLITDEDVVLMMRQRAREFVTLTGSEREVKEKQVYKEELRRLIERELVINEFLSKVRKNKPQLVEALWEEAGSMASRQIQEIRTATGLSNDAEFQQMLQAQGVTMKSFRRQAERGALSNMYVSQYMREKSRNIQLGQVQDYYRRHPDEFKIEDRVVWQHLFVSFQRFNTPNEAKLFAEWLLKNLNAGADFSQLAKQHGHGDSSLREGSGSGNKRGDIRPVELEDTVFSLGIGKTSGIIATGTGYHIVRITERETAGVRPLDEKLQAEIRGKLSDAAFKQERDKMIAELWRRTTVTVVE